MEPVELLLIDGESVERSLVESAAEAVGYRLVAADCVASALAMLDTLKPKPLAVLVCGGVPFDSLQSLLQAVQKLDELENVEVVLHHSELDADRIRWGVEEGAYFYLTKLSEPELLYSMIRSSVHTGRKIRRLAKKVNEVEDTFRLLQEGSFAVRTPAEAELLAANLGSACEDPQQGIGLLELMLNGIEHGNLGISYDEKKDLLHRGIFLEEVQRRLDSPEFSDMRVEVCLIRRQGILEVVIRDQGTGFDFSRYLRYDPKRMLDPNGRGVALAGVCLDLQFVEPGNEVRIPLPIIGNAELTD